MLSQGRRPSLQMAGGRACTPAACYFPCMELYHFEDGKRPHRLATGDALPATGYLWADFTRDEAADWACWAEPVVHSAIDPQHIDDSMNPLPRSEEHTSELQSLMRLSYAAFCLK